MHKSATDWERIRQMRDEDIDTSDAPEITPDIAERGVVRVNLKPVARRKTRLTMYLDNALIEYFKAKAGSRGYQTLINETLKHAILREDLESTLRRVLREERAAYEVKRRR
jgi:uncharacterized protein (DUF4415 family)